MCLNLVDGINILHSGKRIHSRLNLEVHSLPSYLCDPYFSNSIESIRMSSLIMLTKRFSTRKAQWFPSQPFDRLPRMQTLLLTFSFDFCEYFLMSFLLFVVFAVNTNFVLPSVVWSIRFEPKKIFWTNWRPTHSVCSKEKKRKVWKGNRHGEGEKEEFVLMWCFGSPDTSSDRRCTSSLRQEEQRGRERRNLKTFSSPLKSFAEERSSSSHSLIPSAFLTFLFPLLSLFLHPTFGLWESLSIPSWHPKLICRKWRDRITAMYRVGEGRCFLGTSSKVQRNSNIVTTMRMSTFRCSTLCLRNTVSLSTCILSVQSLTRRHGHPFQIFGHHYRYQIWPTIRSAFSEIRLVQRNVSITKLRYMDDRVRQIANQPNADMFGCLHDSSEFTRVRNPQSASLCL